MAPLALILAALCLLVTQLVTLLSAPCAQRCARAETSPTVAAYAARMDAVGQVLLLLGVVMLVTLSTVTLLTVLAVRGARRRFRAVRTGMRVRGVGADRPDLPAVRAAAVATVGSASWWASQRDRQRMWRAVSSAQHAVRVAQQSGAPVGDLPALCTQLTQAAGRVDAVLRATADDRPWRQHAGAAEIERAAHEVNRAAVDSLSMVASADNETVLSAVRLEVAALAAGVRAARLSTRRPA
jgi:hypothetical protein